MIYYVSIGKSMLDAIWMFFLGGAVIYADDVTLLGPTRSSILSMLNICDVYARNMDILFNPAKTYCIFSPAYPNSLPVLPLHFMNTDIGICTFLGIS